jgi:hypothetical protein
MGRHQSNTVEYFPHIAKHGKTLFILKSRFGNDGYAFWFQLLEILCLAENHYYDCRDEEAWQYLLSVTGVDEISGTQILSLLAKLGKIDAELWDTKMIWCQKLVSNLEDVYKKRGRPVPQRPRQLDNNHETATDKTIAATEIHKSVTETPQSKVKESKVNNKPPKGGSRSTKRAAPNPEVKEILTEIGSYLGYPEKTKVDPIPNWAAEGAHLKRILSRGFTHGEIVTFWKARLDQRGGEYVSAHWINQDIGKKLGDRRPTIGRDRVPTTYTDPEDLD